MKTLTIISKLRERNLSSLVPLVKDLTIDIDQIKIIISRTNLEQVKEALEDYKNRRSRVRRKIDDCNTWKMYFSINRDSERLLRFEDDLLYNDSTAEDKLDKEKLKKRDW